jgi:DNA polymerase III delta prime subunit
MSKEISSLKVSQEECMPNFMVMVRSFISKDKLRLIKDWSELKDFFTAESENMQKLGINTVDMNRMIDIMTEVSKRSLEHFFCSNMVYVREVIHSSLNRHKYGSEKVESEKVEKIFTYIRNIMSVEFSERMEKKRMEKLKEYNNRLFVGNQRSAQETQLTLKNPFLVNLTNR